MVAHPAPRQARGADTLAGAEPSAKPEGAAKAPPCVLVVDDDPDCREVVCRLLEKAGWATRAAASIREAAAAAKDPEIALLVTDLWMAGGNGMQLVEELAQSRPELEAVVFSGHATPATRGAARELGCLEVVDKPDFERLLEAARGGLGSDRAERLGAEGRGPARPAPGRILLVDDHAEFMRVVHKFFEKRGCRVTTARDGREALTFFQPGEFDLVLMDVNMPRVDGVEAARSIRRQDPAVSILLVSGEARSRQVFEALAAGADSLLTKPVSLAVLGQKCSEYVELTHRRRRAAGRRKRREERRARRSAPAKAFHWLRSPRAAGPRRRLGLRVLVVLLAVTAGLGAAVITDWTANAGRWTTLVFDSVANRLDRLEGYLQRDEQRDLKRSRREGLD